MSRQIFGRNSLLAVLALLTALVLVRPTPAAHGAMPGTAEEIAQAVSRGQLDREIAAEVTAGRPVDAIVTFDATNVIREAAQRKLGRGVVDDDQLAIIEKIAALGSLKAQARAGLANPPAVLQDFSALPVQHIRIANAESLAALLRNRLVDGVRVNRTYEAQLSQSLPLINQPQVAAAGKTGAGTAVAVIDTGVNYLQAAFGCTALATPAGCRVVFEQDFAPQDNALDAHGHGTNVAGIVAGVASGALILALDVFNGNSASDTYILNALNWVLTTRATYNTVAVNMSLGVANSWNTGACATSYTGVFASLRSAGVLPVVAAGNSAYARDTFLGSPFGPYYFHNGISSPACTAGAVSVGAVYDSAFGTVSFSSCSDSTAADKITCFSQTGPNLSVLAPGGAISAAGITYYGTSQATPHVAGAVAVLKAAVPGASAAQVEAALTGNGPGLTDTRNGLTKRRLDLLAAVTALDPAPTPPDTSITSQPANPTTALTASFSFTSTKSLSTFQCSLDGAAYTACTSPQAYSGLALGPHTFSVRATDGGGLTDQSPASYSWTINAPPPAPDTTITSTPPNPSGAGVSFSFTSTISGSTFACSLDNAAFAACSSPITYSGLANGQHNFRVAATAAGVTDASPAGHTWDVLVVNPAPNTTITSAPANPSSPSVSFSFTSTIGGSTFACSLDNATAVACTSAWAYSGLSNGQHTFRVTATAAGVSDPTPAEYTWTVQAPTTLRVGDIDGSSAMVNSYTWRATVVVTVLDGAGQPVSGALVSVVWSGASNVTATGTTDANGRVTFSRSAYTFFASGNSFTFSVSGVSKSGFSYVPGQNSDPDGDSDGTTIIVNRP